MLARVTYGLVGLALVTLIIGFFTSESNVMLYISIGLSVAAIVLVLVGAARRAREAPADELAAEDYADLGDDDELPDDVLAAFEDEEDEDLAELPDDFDDFDEDEFFDLDEEDEDEDVAPVRSKSKTKAKSKPKAKPKAKAKAKSKSKAKAKATSSSSGKVFAVEGRDRYHAADCRFVRDKDASELEEITPATAKRRGYEPCSVCSPDD